MTPKHDRGSHDPACGLKGPFFMPFRQRFPVIGTAVSHEVDIYYLKHI